MAEAGVYDIPESIYFADPVPSGSLSCSGAKLLLPPSCPALFFWEQDHPPEPKQEFEFGSAVHKIVLGSGPEIAVLDFENWRTKASQEAKKEARERGEIPALKGDYQAALAMADAIRLHPYAGPLFDPDRGEPEQSLFWQDARTGTWRRCRLDWLPQRGPGQMVVPDLKTCDSASRPAFSKAAANFKYDMQDAWYLDGVKAIGLDDDPAFVFVAAEKTPPYLISVFWLDDEARRAGRERNRQAIDLYRRCVAEGEWPGYADGLQTLSLPYWATR